MKSTLQLAGASSRFGADMGRPNHHNRELADEPVAFTLIRIAWVDGDYDSGGAYWGRNVGEDIYRAYAEEAGIELWIRATGSEDAERKVRADYRQAAFTWLPPEDVDPEEPLAFAYFLHFARIGMTRQQAASAAHQGDCDADVKDLRKVPAIARQLDALTPEDVRRELQQEHGFEAGSLSDHDANLDRLLWVAAWQIVEESQDESTGEEG